MGLRKLKRSRKATRKPKRNRPPAPCSAPPEHLLTQADHLLHTGQTARAEEAYKEILAHQPTQPHALHMLGRLAFNGGHDILAEDYLKKSILHASENAEALHALTLLYTETDRPGMALPLLKKALALALAPDCTEYYYTLGNTLFSLESYEAARAAFEKALTLKQNFAEALVGLGNCQEKMGNDAEKRTAYRQALGLDPHLANHFRQKAQLLQKRGKIEQAIRSLKQANTLDPNNVDILINLGAMLREQNLPEKACHYFERALSLHPDSALALYNLANALQDLARFAEAEPLLRRALQLQPDFAIAYSVLVAGKKHADLSHDDILLGEAMLAQEKPASDNAMLLHFALGKAYDDCGEFTRAFAQYRSGNEIKHRSVTFHHDAPRIFVDRLKATFSDNSPNRAQVQGSTSELPVFVVGMPRSGTTLVERIIASHPHAHGIGESDRMNRIADNIGEILVASPATDPIAALTEKHITELTGSYLTAIKGRAGSSFLRIVDKMPQNFFHLGWITMLFPKARIIHCRRNPLDTCLSVFFQFFPGDHPYAYDLKDLVVYYTEYLRIMDHWRKTLRTPMLEVDYEDLIADPTIMAQKIIHFLGLDWDDSCLAFHKQTGSVQSASSWQVRQPLHSRSINRWRNYEEFIGPLVAALAKGKKSN